MNEQDATLIRPELQLLTIDQVAEALGCSRRNVARLHDRGAIPQPVKLGKRLRWRRGEIETWIEEGLPTQANRSPRR